MGVRVRIGIGGCEKGGWDCEHVHFILLAAYQASYFKDEEKTSDRFYLVVKARPFRLDGCVETKVWPHRDSF